MRVARQQERPPVGVACGGPTRAKAASVMPRPASDQPETLAFGRKIAMVRPETRPEPRRRRRPADDRGNP